MYYQMRESCPETLEKGMQAERQKQLLCLNGKAEMLKAARGWLECTFNTEI
jgi:hypothetical protein